MMIADELKPPPIRIPGEAARMLGIGEGSSLGLDITPARELRTAPAVHYIPESGRRLLSDDHDITIGGDQGPFHTHHLSR